MGKKIDQLTFVNKIREKTGFYKKDIVEVLRAFEEVIYESMQTATIDEPSEIRLFNGFVIGAKRIPTKQARDPRNQETITAPEHLNPYARFKPTFKRNLNCCGEMQVDAEYQCVEKDE